jgi:hypothetical protein
VRLQPLRREQAFGRRLPELPNPSALDQYTGLYRMRKELRSDLAGSHETEITFQEASACHRQHTSCHPKISRRASTFAIKRFEIGVEVAWGRATFAIEGVFDIGFPISKRLRTLAPSRVSPMRLPTRLIEPALREL